MSESTSASLTVAVVTPEGSAYEGDADSVVVPGYDGEVAFLKGHAAFVGAIGTGELRVTDREGAVRRWFLEGGVAQVLANEVTVLADRIQPLEDVDKEAAKTELDAALAETPTSDEAFDSRDKRLGSARARLRITEPRS